MNRKRTKLFNIKEKKLFIFKKKKKEFNGLGIEGTDRYFFIFLPVISVAISHILIPPPFSPLPC